MFKKLTVDDFAVLRGALDSGRQSPDSIGFALLLAVFLQSLLYYLTYYVAADSTIYPNVEQIQSLHFWITAVLTLASLIYGIPAIFRRSQKIQYFVMILISLNGIASFCYLCGLFLIGESGKSTEESLLTFTVITLWLALLLFFATFIRFYILLRKGLYRKGSNKDALRKKFETKSYIPAAIVGSAGLVFIIQYVMKTADLDDMVGAVVIVIFFIIFYAMIFILPEQLVILYCKIRFKSFNFNRRGSLRGE